MSRGQAIVHLSPQSAIMDRVMISKADGSVQLARQIDLVGQSGAHYRYNAQEQGKPVLAAGANYVIAVAGRAGTEILFIGETENLASNDWKSPLEQAHGQNRDAELFIRLNVRGAVRKQERDDMIAAYTPALNPS
jgi:cobalamin biosynthesis protein CobT